MLAGVSIPYYHTKPPFSRTKFLQSDSDEVYRTVGGVCLQFAILGYTSVASRLLERLNQYEQHGGHRDIVRPLWFLWDLLGEWPAGGKERMKEEIVRERQNDARKKSGKKAKLEVDQHDVTDEDVKLYLDELAHVFREGWDWPGHASRDDDQNTPFGEVPSPVDVKKAKDVVWTTIDQSFEPLDRDERTGGVAMGVSSGLVGALDLSISLGEEDGTSTEAVLERIATRLNANQAIHCLVQSRRAWDVLKDGILVKLLGLDVKKLDNFATDIEELFEERLKHGRLELEDMSMKETLDMADYNTRNGTEAQAALFEMRRPVPDTLFQNPATDIQISEAEEDLDVELPSDYKEFLRLSNGLGAAFGGIIFEPSLFPVEKARWLADDEDYFTDQTISIPGQVLFDVPRGYRHKDIRNWPQLGKALEIGRGQPRNLWLIPPAKIQEVQKHVANILRDDSEHPEAVREVVRKSCVRFAGNMEKWEALDWCFVTWDSGGVGMTSYPSFKHFMKRVAEGSGSSKIDVLRGGNFFGYFCREKVAHA